MLLGDRGYTGESMSLMIDHAYIITLSRRGIITNGAIVIEKGKIIAVGDSKDINANYDTRDYIDAKGKIALPGIINAHIHPIQTILRGIVKPRPFNEWLKYVYWLRSNLSDEDAYISSMLAIIELIKSGVTCVLEHQSALHDEIGVKVLKVSGLRGIVARIICNEKKYGFEYVEDEEESVEKTCHFIEKFQRYAPRVRCAFGPIGISRVKPKTWRLIAERAREMNALIHTHAAETPSYIKRSEIKKLYTLKVLSRNTSLVHALLLKQEDIKLLRKTNTSVICCPTSNIMLHSRIPPIYSLIMGGVNVALGTDGAAISMPLNMFNEMRVLSIAYELVGDGPQSAISPYHILTMVTRNAAIALNMDKEIGAIDEGRRADVVLLNIQPTIIPRNGIFNNLVHAVIGSEVDTVIVDGKVIMQNGQIITFNEKRILEQAMKIEERISEEIKCVEEHRN